MNTLYACNLNISDLLALFAIIVAGFIGFQQISLMDRQNILNKNSVRLGLFDKRFKIFDETKKVLLKIMRGARIDQDELNGFIKNNKHESKFLFNEDVTNFIEEVFEKAITLNGVSDKLSNSPSNISHRDNLLDERSACVDWFTKQHSEMENKFDKYLNFRDFKMLD